MITIPDFVVKKFVDEDAIFVGVYKSKTMTFTPQYLVNCKVKEGPKNHVLLSSIGMKDFRYSLYYYKWQPDED